MEEKKKYNICVPFQKKKEKTRFRETIDFMEDVTQMCYFFISLSLLGAGNKMGKIFLLKFKVIIALSDIQKNSM